ncbi:MAG: hypothetical protein K6T70_06170 [Meiothermus ruber]|uniref:hypothetical protein n=1 Tax=Meiothermus ruber TaxID=277 RepID=UPI0023F9882D|nr:hypothetical protein [Meiothermus ruber]MCL6529689.1 hypothetical protein [Meiothermus ruber]
MTSISSSKLTSRFRRVSRVWCSRLPVAWLNLEGRTEVAVPLARLAGRLGVAHLRTHHPRPELRRTPELARILAQQAEILSLIARRLS